MAGEAILIVDDNAVNLKLLRITLAVAGYDVQTAIDAEQAMSVLALFRPRLILMDIQLPGMNGIDALRVLRSDPATRKIPVIAVTASVMQQDRKLITEAGFDGYVGKPISLNEFLDAVNSMLARHSG